MGKRFTDTEKWKKKNFRKLSTDLKLFWFYILDDCNHAGIFEADVERANFEIGTKLKESEILKAFKTKIYQFDNNEKWFIPAFIDFQYGQLNEHVNAHKSVIKILNKYNLYKNLDKINQELVNCSLTVNQELLNSSITVKDQDQDQDQDQDMAKDKEALKNNIKIIIDYVNLKCNKKFTYRNKEFNKHINARLREKYKIDDFKKVIDNKLKDKNFKDNPGWYNPSTLFRESNFEKYLNEYHRKTDNEIQAEKEKEDQELERELQKKLKEDKEKFPNLDQSNFMF